VAPSILAFWFERPLDAALVELNSAFSWLVPEDPCPVKLLSLSAHFWKASSMERESLIEKGTYFFGAGSGLAFSGGFSRSGGFLFGTYRMLLKLVDGEEMRLHRRHKTI
jgi:hypothetical protein